MSESSIEAKVEQLCTIILKTEEFWETKNKALLVLIDLFLPYEGQSEDLINEVFSANVFRLLKEPVKVMICDLRSQQVRDICSLLSSLARICGDRMKLFLRDSFVHILNGVKVPNTVMSGYVDDCIITMIRNATFKSAIPLIISEIKENKSRYVRERSLDYLNEMLINWDLGDKEADLVCDAIRLGLEDAAVKGREIARAAYMNMFQLHPKKTEKIKAALTNNGLKAKLNKSEQELLMQSSSLSTESDQVSVESTPSKSKTVSHASSAISSVSKPSTASTPAVNTPAHLPAHHNKAPTDEKHEKLSIQTNMRASTAKSRRRSVVPNPFESITSCLASEVHEEHIACLSISSETSLGSTSSLLSASPGATNGKSKSSPSKAWSSITAPTASSSNNVAPKSPKLQTAASMYNLSSPKAASVGGSSFSSSKSLSKHDSFRTSSNGHIGSTIQGNHHSLPPNTTRDKPAVPLAVNNTTTTTTTTISSKLSVGMVVRVLRGTDPSAEGVVRFVGNTLFAGGTWVGVELSTDVGKNNGSVQGHAYFECPPNKGLFAREENVEELSAGKNTAQQGAAMVEQRTQIASLLKLKLSQLMNLLNHQLEIVNDLEQADATSGLDAVCAEIQDITAQEAELVEAFRRRLQIVTASSNAV